MSSVEVASSPNRPGGMPPVRGTQSFVKDMSLVWRRPGLTAIEVLWRWIAGLPLLWIAGRAGARALGPVSVDLARVEDASLLQPAQALHAVQELLFALWITLAPTVWWLVPVGLVVWVAASTVGRGLLWRRLDPALRPRPGLLSVVSGVRVLLLAGAYALWIWGLVRAAQVAISGPAQRGEEPNLVLYTALAVGFTLLLFMSWSLFIWILDVAPLFAMRYGLSFGGSLRAAAEARSLRPKLMETNLVMGIVKVCLLVLAMVFSATPLPFASVESTVFLRTWWAFVAVLFVLALDLFHVIRRSAYLSLFSVLMPPASDATSPKKAAS